MKGADLLVLPSQTENFAQVVIEALSVGLPVVLSENIGLADYVSDHQLGWIFSKNHSLKEVLAEAFRDREKRERINLSSSKKIHQDFDRNELIVRYKKMYRESVNL
jgi:glycosyltransferase involved in cell wall biosynthesis